MLNRRNFLQLTGLAAIVGIGIPGCSNKEYWESRRKKAEDTKLMLEQELKEHNKPVVGTVIKDTYTSYYGESLYHIKIKTDDGREIVVNVTDHQEKGEKEALKSLIQIGDRVSFPRGNVYIERSDQFTEYRLSINPEQTYFHETTQIGNKYARLIIVEKKK